MDAKSYSAVRKKLAKTMEKVCEETAYLLRNPVNAKRLHESIKQVKKGKTIHKELIEK